MIDILLRVLGTMAAVTAMLCLLRRNSKKQLLAYWLYDNEFRRYYCWNRGAAWFHKHPMPGAYP